MCNLNFIENAENNCKSRNMIEMLLRSYLTLEKMSCIKIAIVIWQKTDIRNRVRDHFLKDDSVEDLENWIVLMDSILEDTISKIPLPRSLKHNLHGTLLLLGLKIRHWIIYLKINLYESYAHQEFDFIEGIHWTTYGTIDTSKTILTIIDKHVERRQYMSAPKLYSMASKHCLTEHLIKMMKSSDRCYELKRMARISQYNLLVDYWHMWYLKKANIPRVYTNLISTEQLRRQLHYQERLSLNELLTRYSMRGGFFLAVKYFWKKLDELEQQRVLELFGTRFPFLRDLPEHQAEMCLFFLGKMMNKQEMAITWETKLNILSRILLQWPYQELFMLLVEEWVRPEITKSTEEAVYIEMLELVLKIISFSDIRQLTFIEREILVKIFTQLWIKAPIESRRILCCHANLSDDLYCREGREIVKSISYEVDIEQIFFKNRTERFACRPTLWGHSAANVYLYNLMGIDEKMALRIRNAIYKKNKLNKLLRRTLWTG